MKTLLYKRNPSERNKIVEFVKGLPLFYDNVEVAGEMYYLVHGKPPLLSAKEISKKQFTRIPWD